MLITDIKQQKKRPGRFSIFVDGKYSFSMSLEDLQNHGLRLQSELSDSQIVKYKKISKDSLWLNKAYEKCLRRPHSVKEIEDYLSRNKVDDDLVSSIISKCLDKKLLNDEDFAQRWHDHRKKSGKSNRYIYSELLKKGVDKQIVESVVKNKDDSALVYMINKKKSRYSDEKKLINYLQGQGFNYYDILEKLKYEQG